MYQYIRRLFFKYDAEKAHHLAMSALKSLCAAPPVQKVLETFFSVNDARLQRSAFGLTFKNGVGLGAGFDKNATYLRELQTLGFGFVEIGTVITTIIAVFDNAFKNSLSLNKLIQFLPSLKTNTYLVFSILSKLLIIL